MSRRWKIALAAAAGCLTLALVSAAGLVLWALSHASGETRPLGGQWEVFHAQALMGEPDPHHIILRRRRLLFSRGVAVVHAYRYLGDDCVAYVSFNHDLYGACGDRPPAYVTYVGEMGSLTEDPLRIDDRLLPLAEVSRFAREPREQSIGGGWRAQEEALAPVDGPRGILIYRKDRPLWPHVRSPVVRYRYVGDDCLLLLGFLADLSAVCGDGEVLYVSPLADQAEFDNDAVRIYNGVATVDRIKRQAKRCREKTCASFQVDAERD